MKDKLFNNKEYWSEVWEYKKTFKSKYPTNELPWDIKSYDFNLKNILETYEISKGLALDIGCGSGYDTDYLSKKGFNVIGIDIAKKAIEIANEKHLSKNCSFKNIDFYDCFYENYFNFIYDRGCLHNNISNIENYFNKCYTMLKKNGYVCCLMGNNNDTDNTTTKPTKVNINNIIESSLKFFQIKLLKEINFRQAKGFNDGLGWLLLLHKSSFNKLV